MRTPAIDWAEDGFGDGDSQRKLAEVLSGRVPPETALALVLDAFGDTFSPADRALVLPIASARAYRSEMPPVFDPVAGVFGPLATLCALTGVARPARAAAADPAFVRGALDRARTGLGMSEGRADYKHDRLDRAARKAQGMWMSRRRYDKLFRLVGKIESETSEMADQSALFELGRFAKIGFAPRIDAARLVADPAAASFVAYYTANLARRSVFTAGKQARALDTVAARLLERCGPESDWYSVAHVFPRADVLARLADAQRLALLDMTLAVMGDAAARLEACVARNSLDMVYMTVARGQDSSTWNALGGAWNRARDFWLALVWSTGNAAFADAFLPGKVMRLMAADVVAWHRSIGEGVHPDTLVWDRLPKPWDVVAGRATCTRAQVEAACAACGVDAAASGWAAPRARAQVVEWAPTPELVHGVAVDHPALAKFLRHIGVFSGKEIRLGAGA